MCMCTVRLNQIFDKNLQKFVEILLLSEFGPHVVAALSIKTQKRQSAIAAAAAAATATAAATVMTTAKAIEIKLCELVNPSNSVNRRGDQTKI